MTNASTESFDLHIHAFTAGEAQTIAGIEQMFGVDAAQAARVYAAVPTTIKRGLSHDEALNFATALQRIGAQVSLTLSQVEAQPSTAEPEPEPEAESAADRDRRNELVRKLLDAGERRPQRPQRPQTWSGHDIELPPDTPEALAPDPNPILLIEEQPAELFPEGWMPGADLGPSAPPPPLSLHDALSTNAKAESADPPKTAAADGGGIKLPDLLDDEVDAAVSAIENSIPPALGGGDSSSHSIPPALGGGSDSIPPALGGGDSIPPALGGGESIPPALAAAAPAAAAAIASILPSERKPTYLDALVHLLDNAQHFVTNPNLWTRRWAETTVDELTPRRGVRRTPKGSDRFFRELAAFILWLYDVLGPAFGWLGNLLTRRRGGGTGK